MNSNNNASASDRIIRIRALKYGEIPHYEWDTTLIEQHADYLLVRGERNRKLLHHRKGIVLNCESPSIELYPFNEWFTVSIEKTAASQLNCYCNIAMPSQLGQDNLSFIDLDLDIVRRPLEEWQLIDEDEFFQHAEQFGYPQNLIDRAQAEAKNLMARIQSARFPFDGWLDRWLNTI